MSGIFVFVATINTILTAIFDTLYGVLGLMPAWVSLTVLSVLAGILALIVVRYCSSQDAMARVKDDIKANMLALKLFRDELRVVFRSQLSLLWAALRVQGLMIPPLLVMFIPFVLVAAQMGLRYQWRPVRVGEPVVLTATLRPDAPASAYDIQLAGPEGVAIDPSLRVRAIADHTVSWEIVGTEESGSNAQGYPLTLSSGDLKVTKQFHVGADAGRVCPVRPGDSFLDKLLYPAESPLSAESLIESVRIDYPLRSGWYSGADWWILWLIVVSVVAAFLLKPLFGVKL